MEEPAAGGRQVFCAWRVDIDKTVVDWYTNFILDIKEKRHLMMFAAMRLRK